MERCRKQVLTTGPNIAKLPGSVGQCCGSWSKHIASSSRAEGCTTGNSCICIYLLEEKGRPIGFSLPLGKN